MKDQRGKPVSNKTLARFILFLEYWWLTRTNRGEFEEARLISRKMDELYEEQAEREMKDTELRREQALEDRYAE